jgi:hypothetical protein
MATKANLKKVKISKEVLAAERLDKAFRIALTKVEEVVKQRILEARDPFRTGLSLAREIRRVADNIDADVIAQCIDETEASIVLEENQA